MDTSKKTATILWNDMLAEYVVGELIVSYHASAHSNTIFPAIQKSVPSIIGSKSISDTTSVLCYTDKASAVEVISAVSKIDGVAWVEPNFVVQLPNDIVETPCETRSEKVQDVGLTPNDPLFNQQWAIPNVGIDRLWDFTQGSSEIMIGIVDSGIRATHEDLQSNANRDIVLGSNFIDPRKASIDDNGHGTMIAGIITATPNNGTGIAGINWYSKVYICKTFDSFGRGDMANHLRAVNEMIAYAQNEGLKLIINLSLGDYSRSNSAYQICSSIRNNNGIAVISCGNEGYDFVTYPAVYASAFSDNVVAVSTLDQNNTLYGSASTGLGLTCLAPGVNIMTTSFSGDSQYVTRTGSSLSAAVVSGLVSLLWSADLSKRPDQVIGELKLKCIRMGTSEYDTTYGYGRVNTNALNLKSASVTGWGNDKYLTDLCTYQLPNQGVPQLAYTRFTGEHARYFIDSALRTRLKRNKEDGGGWSGSLFGASVTQGFVYDNQATPQAQPFLIVGRGVSGGAISNSDARIIMYNIGTNTAIPQSQSFNGDWDKSQGCSQLDVLNYDDNGCTKTILAARRSGDQHARVVFYDLAFQANNQNIQMTNILDFGGGWGGDRKCTCIALKNLNGTLYFAYGRDGGNHTSFALDIFDPVSKTLRTIKDVGWGRACVDVKLIRWGDWNLFAAAKDESGGGKSKVYLYAFKDGQSPGDAIEIGQTWPNGISCLSLAFGVVGPKLGPYRLFLAMGRVNKDQSDVVIYEILSDGASVRLANNTYSTPQNLGKGYPYRLVFNSQPYKNVFATTLHVGRKFEDSDNPRILSYLFYPTRQA